MNESHIVIGRPINGISLNGLEYLLDKDNKELEFKDKQAAKDYLRGNGFDHLSDSELEDAFVFQEEKH